MSLPHALPTILRVGSELVDTFVFGDGLVERATQYGCSSEEVAQLSRIAVRKESGDRSSGVQQSVVFEQCAKFLQGVSTHKPLLLVLEDLHWADPGTVGLLCHLAKQVDGYPIMLVGSYRPADLAPTGDDDRHPLESARHELQRKFGDFEIAVGETETRDFVDALLDAWPNLLDAEFRDALYRQTRGQPLFTVELLRDLRERGVLERDSDGQVFVSQEIDWEALPVRVEAVIGERIGRLPESLQRLLKVASIEGEDLTAEVVARIEGLDESEVIRLLSNEADKRHQLVRALDVRRSGSQRLSVYRFRHILFQKYLYQSLDRVERSFLHETVGNTLESLLGERAGDASVQLARHFQEAGLADKAFHYLVLAGHKTRQSYASQEAKAFYTRALDALSAIGPPGNDARLIPVYEGRGLVSTWLTQFDAAIADFQEMLRVAKVVGDIQMEAQSLSHLAYSHFLKMGDDHIPVMENYALQALELAKKTGDPSTLSKSLSILGIVSETRGDLLEAERKLEESLSISRREGFQSTRVRTLFHLGQQAYWQADFVRAVRIGEEGVTVSAEIRDSFNELFNSAVVCLSAWGAGDYRKAFHVLDEGKEKAKESENRFMYGRLCNTLGCFHRELGDPYGAVEAHEEALELARRASVFNVEISALIDLGHDHLALGQTDRALSYLVPTLERVEREGIGSHRWRWIVRLLNMIAEVHYATENYDEASRYVELGIERARATRSQKYLANAQMLRGKIATKLGDMDAAATDLDGAFAVAEKLGSPSITYPIAHELGIWCEENGREARARELHGRAKEAVERIVSGVDDGTLRSVFLKSRLVQAVNQK